MNIAYCEDEKIQLEYMEQLIRKWADEGNDTVTYFGYGSAKELLFEHPDSFPFDLLLLDIDMDGMDGMALAKEIRKKDQKLPIVFLTNRSEYVFEGYEVGALRYLLKAAPDGPAACPRCAPRWSRPCCTWSSGCRSGRLFS